MIRVCKTCGTKFKCKPSAVARGSGSYCSKVCLYEGHTIRARARRTEPEPSPVEGARWIALNKGFALVDADRFEELNAFVWSASGRNGQYAARGIGTKTLSLHHAVLGIPSHIHVDHKNGNGHDCRANNLRVANNSLNHANIGKIRKPTSSKFKGVHWRKDRGKWSAEIKIEYRHLKLGCYTDEREAALAYDRAAIQHFGEFAKTNFPPEAHPS